MIKSPGMGYYSEIQDDREKADANGEPYVKKSFQKSRGWPIFSSECEAAIAPEKKSRKKKVKKEVK